MVKKALQHGIKTSIVEKAKNDKNIGLGVGRGNRMEHTRETFKAWLLMPRTFLGAGEHVLNALGIREPEVMELFGIKSQSEFATRFGVAEPTLSHWKREMHRGSDFQDFRVQMQQLTKNVMGALYRKTIEDGDAARVKLWMQVVEGWNERIVQDVNTNPCELSDEEKVTLDRLIRLNT